MAFHYPVYEFFSIGICNWRTALMGMDSKRWDGHLRAFVMISLIHSLHSSTSSSFHQLFSLEARAGNRTRAWRFADRSVSTSPPLPMRFWLLYQLCMMCTIVEISLKGSACASFSCTFRHDIDIISAWLPKMIWETPVCAWSKYSKSDTSTNNWICLEEWILFIVWSSIRARSQAWKLLYVPIHFENYHIPAFFYQHWNVVRQQKRHEAQYSHH